MAAYLEGRHHPQRAILVLLLVLGACFPPPPQGAEPVIVVHGLGRTEASMSVLGYRPFRHALDGRRHRAELPRRTFARARGARRHAEPAESGVGPAGASLGTDSLGIASQLGPVHFSLGIITGDRSIHAITSWLIPGDDDGKVSVDRARIEGADGFLVVPASHTFIMNREDVGTETLHVLEHGRFTGGAP